MNRLCDNQDGVRLRCMYPIAQYEVELAVRSVCKKGSIVVSRLSMNFFQTKKRRAKPIELIELIIRIYTGNSKNNFARAFLSYEPIPKYRNDLCASYSLVCVNTTCDSLIWLCVKL